MRKWTKVILLGCLLLLVLSICGCTTTQADYSSNYDKIWMQDVLIKPFYKTVSERNNDLYVGQVQNASSSEIATITFEHVGTQGEAVSIYHETINKAVRDGYISQFIAPDNFTELWWGHAFLRSVICGYYPAHEGEGTGWVVETQYVA